MPLPETPQDYYAYFHRQRLSAQPPSEKWAIGEQAAQLWIDYHDQPNAGLDTLITFVRILMPYRYAGSGFYDLWTRVIRYSHDLPVPSQTALWHEIFNPTHYGDRHIKYTDQAHAVIHQWQNLAESLSYGRIETAQVQQLAEMIAPYFVRSQAYEWTALTYALQTWLEKIWPETPFLDLGMFQTRPISLYSLAARLAQNVPAVYG